MHYLGLSSVTSKGQITLPADLRQRLDLKAGDTVEFFEGHDGAIKVRARGKPASAIIGLLAHLKPDPRFDDDDEAIAEEIAERDRRSRKGISEVAE